MHEFISAIATMLREFGLSNSKYTVEMSGAVLGLVLAGMRTYAFGRDRLLKKVKLFMLGEEGFSGSKALTKHVSSGQTIAGWNSHFDYSELQRRGWKNHLGGLFGGLL